MATRSCAGQQVREVENRKRKAGLVTNAIYFSIVADPPSTFGKRVLFGAYILYVPLLAPTGGNHPENLEEE